MLRFRRPLRLALEVLPAPAGLVVVLVLVTVLFGTAFAWWRRMREDDTLRPPPYGRVVPPVPRTAHGTSPAVGLDDPSQPGETKVGGGGA